ncbi:MAG: hypothetical protein JOZ69_17990, partial [Myxococcales bacterium]|nr:hypothetical protein [Myxococcales bacterium]
MSRRRVRRIMALSAAAVMAPPVLAASCTESFPRSLVTNAATSTVDATSTDDATSDGPPLAWCAPSPGPEGCTGSDPAYVFYPALSCDRDGSAGDATDSDAGLVVFQDAAALDGAVVQVNTCAIYRVAPVIFTPAACRAFAAAEVEGGLASEFEPGAPQFDEPKNGDPLTPDMWQTFAWHKEPGRDARRGGLLRAAELLEPAALASSPLSGTAYVLEFAQGFAQGCTEVLRVMAPVPFWAPDPASWNTLSSLDGPVMLRVVEVHFS